MNAFEWILRHARAIAFITLGLCVLGIITAINLPVAIFPTLTVPRIIIAAEGGDAPAASVLVSTTKPIEDSLSTIPGLRLVQSQTVRGSAGFTLTFADGTDMAQTLQMVNAKLAELKGTLPNDVKTSAERLNPTVFPIVDYSISSNTRSLADLRTLALYTIRPRIARVPGVARVLINGGDITEMVVTARPEQLASYQIPLSAIEDAITKSNTIAAAGGYDYRYQHQTVIVSGLLTDVESVKHLVVAVRNRVPITIGDVADVQEQVQRKKVIATGHGREAVLMNIIRQPEGNTIQVARDVAHELAQLKSTLPADVEISPFYDQSQIVSESAISVVEAIAIGGFLALIVISWFLHNFRSAIVALAQLPITLLVTFVALRLLGMTLNIMTLGALAVALGLVIDDSIVVVEHIFAKLEEGLEKGDAVPIGLREITPAMFASSLATIVVFTPLMLLPGVTGNFFAPLAETMIATLVISLVLSITVIPLLASWLFPKIAHISKPALSQSEASDPSDSSESRGQRPETRDQTSRLPQMYAKILRFVFRRHTLSLVLVGLFAIISIFAFRNLETGFMPEFDEGAFVLDYKMPAGTSLAETDRVMKQVDQILANTEGVQTWSRLTGALSGSGLEIATPNQGDILVRLKSGRRPPVDDVIKDVRTQVLTAVPNVQLDIKQILGDLIGDLAGTPSPIEVKIFGPDINQLRPIADKVSDTIGKIKGVVDVSNGVIEGGPEAVFAVDPIRAAELGFTTEAISAAATGALEGDVVSSIRKGDILEPVRVRYPYVLQSNQQQVEKQFLVNPSGQSVPVESLGTVQVVNGSPELDRENQRLMVSVTARLDPGLDLGSGVAAVQREVSKITLPPGYTIEYGGLYKSQQESFTALRNVLLTAAGLVFVVLLLTFRSFRITIALFIAAVLALSGVVWALALTGTPLNISSYTGAIMIVGIVTENGVLLFDQFRRLSPSNLSDLRDPEEHHEQLISAGVSRLRPILMTTSAAILTLVPLALGIGAGAAMQQPLAIAVIGGLALSTFFTLVFAPLLYSVLHRTKHMLVRR